MDQFQDSQLDINSIIFFNVRIVSEYNTFSGKIFYTTINSVESKSFNCFLYWRKSKFTLNDFNDDMYSIFRVDQTQIFLKFQYLIGL